MSPEQATRAAAELRPDETAPPEGDPRLAEAVEEYRAALKAGRPLSRQELYARYPDLAGTLAQCLGALEFMHAAVEDASRTSRSSAVQANPGLDDVRPGEPLGDFRILREVGRGGMGVVYEAEQASLRRRVALKVMPFAAVLDPRQLQRFRNEAQAAACLHHPNIVPVYAVGCERGVHFYAMQLINGQTVAALIHGLRREAGLLPLTSGETTTSAPVEDAEPAAAWSSLVAAAPETGRPRVTERSVQAPAFFRAVARLGLQAAEGLDHAHQQGIVHRDVKPANLLIDATGKVWITDFGLAQLQGHPALTASGDVVGTLRYMSPEQALAHRGYLDHRTDVYSLGVTLYELVSLEPAFAGDNRQEVLRRLALEEPRTLRRLNRAVPADLETIIGKAMASSPDERYATAHEMADDLRRFLDDQPVLARRPSTLLRLHKWAWRRRAVLGSFAASVALLLVGLAYGMTVYALEQRQLADDRVQLARENEDARLKAEDARVQAEKALHRALIGWAGTIRGTRQPGYRGKVWKALLEATALDVPNRDLKAIRTEVLASLGDPVGLDPVPLAGLVPRQRRMLPEAYANWFPVGGPGPTDLFDVTPGGEYLALRGDPKGWPAELPIQYVRIVDPFNNQTNPKFSPLGAIYEMRFTPNGHDLVAGCEEGFVCWGVPNLAQRSLVRCGNVFGVDVHPNGRLLVASGRQLELWSFRTNRLIASFQPPAVGAKGEFSADGKLLLAVAGGKVVAAWPIVQTPEKQAVDGHLAGVPTVAFSPDGRQLASVCKDGSVCLWDAASGKLLHNCKAHKWPVEAAAFSPDGKWLVTGDIGEVIHLWDAHSGAKLRGTGGGRRPPGQVWRLQFTTSGEHVVAAGKQGLAVWAMRAEEGDVRMELVFQAAPPGPEPMIYDMAVHPGGDYLVFEDHVGRLYQRGLAPASESRLLDAPAQVQLRGLHFDGAGKRLTFVSRAGTLAIWDWKERRAHITDQRFSHLAFDASGRWAASSTSAQAVVVYDVDKRQPLVTLPPEGSDVWSLAWSPQGDRLAVGLSDGGVNIWDLEQVRARLGEFGIAIPSTRTLSR